MTYPTLETINGTGITGIFQTVSAAVPIFPALILFAVWSILTFGMFFSSVRRVGKGDFPACFAVGGFVTSLVAFLMQLIPNFITTYTIVPVVALEIIAVVILISSKQD